MTKIMESLKPEQKLARRFAEMNALNPPVNIESLLKRFADVEEAIIPGSVDAVTINKCGRRLIIVDVTQAYYRRRFTLAHELGHILIPWHIGTLSCHSDGYLTLKDDIYTSVEAEANRFASEILMPFSWLKEVVLKYKEPSEIIQYVSETADVSLIAASLSIYQLLDPGYVIIIDQGGSSPISVRSPGTLVDIQNKKLDESLYDQFCSEQGSIDHDIYAIKWWKFEDTHYAGEIYLDDSRTASEIIKEIAYSCYHEEMARHKIQSLSGVVGAMKSMHKPTDFKDCINKLQQRVAGRSEFKEIVSHPDFGIFLVKKSQEIMVPKAKK